MKKTSSVILVCLFAAVTLFFYACNKDKEGNVVITVNGKATDTMTLVKEGEAKTVVVRASKAWTAEAVEWASATPTSGAANQDITVSISAGASDTERLGGVVFKVESGEFAELLVTQKGN